MSNSKIQLEDFIKDDRFELKKYLTSLFNQVNTHFKTAHLTVCKTKNSEKNS